MIENSEPYNPYPGDGGTSGGVDSGITGGTGSHPPTWRPGGPGGHGWWELVGGVWRWMTQPPRTVQLV